MNENEKFSIILGMADIPYDMTAQGGQKGITRKVAYVETDKDGNVTYMGIAKCVPAFTCDFGVRGVMVFNRQGKLTAFNPEDGA